MIWTEKIQVNYQNVQGILELVSLFKESSTWQNLQKFRVIMILQGFETLTVEEGFFFRRNVTLHNILLFISEIFS